MHELESLLGRAAIPVALEHTGEPRRVPHVVGCGAYRVVRDALTAARAATAASVAIEFMPGAVAVQVVDDGAGARDLEAAADVAAALGGGLKAVATPEGFRVRAWLPTEAQPPSLAALLATP
jgi:signal transduction histidine kinase